MLRRKMHFIMGGVLVLLVIGAVNVQAAPSVVCDGLSGSAWGLCRAGAAVGCDTGTGDEQACASIEDSYLRVTGSDAPWITPPAECPCDFSAVAKTLWDPPLGTDIDFVCPDSFAVMRDNHDTEIGTTSVYDPFCAYFSNEAGLYFLSYVTMEEFSACRQAVIDYAQEFMLLNPGVIVNDTCTPTLN